MSIMFWTVIVSLIIVVNCGKSEPSHNFSVVIVGAGASGLAAATKFLERGFTDFVVLEALPRIGGRVNSVPFGDAKVDLGAQWCHGEVGNVVYDLVEGLGYLNSTTYKYKLYHSSRRIIREQFSDELDDIFNSIFTADGHRGVAEGVSLGTYFHETYTKIIEERYASSPKKLKLAQEAEELFQHVALSDEAAPTWFDVSAEHDYRNIEGDLYLNWNGNGYITAIHELMKQRTNKTFYETLLSKIILNKEVTKIIWDGNLVSKGGSIVKCLDGSTYKSDHVIVTVSLGVLKERHLSMFYPKLPLEKQTVIKDLGMGLIMKAMLYYEDPWWNEDTFDGNHFVWSKEDLQKVLLETGLGPVQGNQSWLFDFYGVYPMEQNSKVVSAWFSGSMVRVAETLPSRVFGRGVTYIINKFLGGSYNITKLTKFLRSTWYANPYTRGTYSYQTIRSRMREESPEKILSKPLINSYKRYVVLFAGEATHPDFYSTVHGAIETGYREANRVLYDTSVV